MEPITDSTGRILVAIEVEDTPDTKSRKCKTKIASTKKVVEVQKPKISNIEESPAREVTVTVTGITADKESPGPGQVKKVKKPTFFKSLLSSSNSRRHLDQSATATRSGSGRLKKKKHKLTFASASTSVLDQGPSTGTTAGKDHQGHDDESRSIVDYDKNASGEGQNMEIRGRSRDDGHGHAPEYAAISKNGTRRDDKASNRGQGHDHELPHRHKHKKRGAVSAPKKPNPSEKPRSMKNQHHHNRERSKDIFTDDDRMTLDKAAIILYEDQKAKEKLKAAVADLSNSCEMYRYELEKQEEQSAQEILKLQLENETLFIELGRLNDLSDHWKSKCQRQENDNVNISKLKLLSKENGTLKEDLEVLKSVVRRLNQEMAFYQEKLRLRYSSEPNKIPVFSTSSSESNGNSKSTPISPESNNEHDVITTTRLHNYEINQPKKNLLPLLTAYDEVIQEKNEIIKDHEYAMGTFKIKCQEIVQENEQLHRIIGESKDKGTISIDEWKFLHDNAVTVLEENDILHDKIKMLKDKAKLADQTHQERVGKLKAKIALMEGETNKLKNSVKDMQTQCTLLTDQISKMSQAIQQRIPVEEHDASIRECKQLFEELKRKYAEERYALTEKLRAVEAEKKRLGDEVTDLDAANAKLQASAKALQESISVSNSKLKNVTLDLTDATKMRQVTSNTVNEMMELAKSAITEREALQVSFHEQRALNEQLMALRVKESELVEELREKIKLMENVHTEEIEKYRDHISKLESVLESVGDRHQADISRVKELLSEKTVHIEKLKTEKEQVMEDLETVWRATTRDSNNSRPIPLPLALLKKYNNQNTIPKSPHKDVAL